eukprot:gene1797-2003_t
MCCLYKTCCKKPQSPALRPVYKWCHIGPKCGKVTLKDYKDLEEKHSFDWICPKCRRREGSYTDNVNLDNTGQHITNEEVSNIKDRLSQQPGLKVGHLNADGLRGKLPEIRQLLQETQLDILIYLAITETKLSATVNDNDVCIDGYFVVRKDRDRNGGGVLIYYKELLTAYEEINLKVPSEMEGIWINVKSQSQTWLVACMYRPP